MLREIVTEKLRCKNTRWFTSEAMDLYLSCDADGNLATLQVCYDKLRHERIFSWQANGPSYHAAIDSGEENPEKNMTPMVVPDGLLDRAHLIQQLQLQAASLEQGMVAQILRILQEGSEWPL